MKPGTPVTNIEPLTDGPHTIPPGTLGVIEWCDRARGEAAVQFIGYTLQRGVAEAVAILERAEAFREDNPGIHYRDALSYWIWGEHGETTTHQGD